MDTDPAA